MVTNIQNMSNIRKRCRNFFLPFFMGSSQTFLVAANTVFLAKSYLPGILVASFLIQVVWIYNVRKAVIGDVISKAGYVLGATTGAVLAHFLTEFILP